MDGNNLRASSSSPARDGNPRAGWSLKTPVLLLILVIAALYRPPPSDRITNQRQPLKKIETDTFRILCTATHRQVRSYGTRSWKIRCLDFQQWVDQCVVPVGTSSSDDDDNNHNTKKKNKNKPKQLPPPTIQVIARAAPTDPKSQKSTVEYYRQHPNEAFDATIQVKDVFGYQTYMGRTVLVDVVDQFGLKSHKIPSHYEVIAQNNAQAALYQDLHSTHVIEHPYTFCAVCQQQGELRKQFTQDDPLLAMSIIWQMPQEHLGDGELVARTVPNASLWLEKGRGKSMQDFYRQALQQRYQLSDSERTAHVAQSIYNATIHAGGLGYVYNKLFRYFDVLVVYMKGAWDKQLYGSVQRITNQMHSGVPVLVEAVGVFETFIRENRYSCGFAPATAAANGTNTTTPQQHSSYPSLTQLLGQLRDDYELRRKCQQQGLAISSRYSQSKIGQATLRAAGYKGEYRLTC